MGKTPTSGPNKGQAGPFHTLSGFAAIGGAMQAAKNSVDHKQTFSAPPEGMVRSGKGGLKYKSEADKQRIEGVQKQKMSSVMSYANSVGGAPSIPFMGKRRVNRAMKKMSTPGMGITNKKYKFPSTPAMGVYGGMGGAYVGKKIGGMIGSAGKLLGKKSGAYGKAYGEYIGSAVGGGLGAVYIPV